MVIRFFHLLLSICLGVSVALPWFELPLFGWQVPVPAWNKVGLAILLLSAISLVRGVGFAFMRWPLRVLLPLAAYGWWLSPAETRNWGVSLFAPLQMKFSSLNSALSQLGLEPFTVFESQLWRELNQGPGYTLAGVSFGVLLLVTALDHPKTRRCGNCQAKAKLTDKNCHACGSLIAFENGCRGCGHQLGRGDQYCRQCGEKASPSVA